MTSITIPYVGIALDVQMLTSLVAMGVGIVCGWAMARSHYIQKGWQYCTCPALMCEHCTKDYVGDAEVGAKIVEEALSGCDVHEDAEVCPCGDRLANCSTCPQKNAEGLMCDKNCSQPCRNPNHGVTF